MKKPRKLIFPVLCSQLLQHDDNNGGVLVSGNETRTSSFVLKSPRFRTYFVTRLSRIPVGHEKQK